MLRPPPRSTRTDTRCPYTTLFRSPAAIHVRLAQAERALAHHATVEMRIVHLRVAIARPVHVKPGRFEQGHDPMLQGMQGHAPSPFIRSEEHTSELQSLMRISYAVFCLKKKKHT